MCQKLISKKEARPIPSQPKNITTRLSALTKISIPAAIQSVYFRGKRYQYSDYLKIIKQANKNQENKLDS